MKENCSELSPCEWCNKFDAPCQDICNKTLKSKSESIDYEGYLEIGNDGELYITTADGIEHYLAQEINDKKLSCYYERRPKVRFIICKTEETK